jgi:hypothetical protein
MKLPQEGSCQCGQVRYALSAEPVGMHICHCTECQKQSGSAFSMTLTVAHAGFRLLRGSLKSFTRIADTGRKMQCFFCPECGTRIYHAGEVNPDLLRLKPGTLDDTSWLKPNKQFWMRSRQPWLELNSALQPFDKQSQ